MPGRNAGTGRSDDRERPGPSAERRAIDELFSSTYEELRRLASAVQRSDASATISPTALVNEAWLKLANSPHLGPVSRLHFKRIAARAMRQVLIEAARRRRASKRGGSVAMVVTLDESTVGMAACGHEVLALDTALDELARIHPRQAQIVEARFFGGFDIGETAEMLDVSEATVLRDWRVARAWLSRQVRHA